MSKGLAIIVLVACGFWLTTSVLFATKTVEPTIAMAVVMSVALSVLSFCNAMALLQEKGK